MLVAPLDTTLASEELPLAETEVTLPSAAVVIEGEAVTLLNALSGRVRTLRRVLGDPDA